MIGQPCSSQKYRAKQLTDEDEITAQIVELASHAAFRIRSEDVKNVLQEVMVRKGTPEYFRNDIGSEFIAKHLRA